MGKQWDEFWSLHKGCEDFWLLMREDVMFGTELGLFPLSSWGSIWFGFTIIPLRHRQIWAAELFLSSCPRCLRAEGTCWITVFYKQPKENKHKRDAGCPITEHSGSR